MFRSIYRISIPVLVLLIFGFQAALYSPDLCAQGLMKSADVPGGSGSTEQAQGTGGDNSTLLIVGGIVIAGLLLYALVIKKDEPNKGEKQDSSSNQSLFPESKSIRLAGTVSESIRKMQRIPVNFYFGFQRVDPVLPERKFIMGISCNF